MWDAKGEKQSVVLSNCNAYELQLGPEWQDISQRYNSGICILKITSRCLIGFKACSVGN